MTVEQRRCAFCGEVFVPSAEETYCSERCAERAAIREIEREVNAAVSSEDRS